VGETSWIFLLVGSFAALGAAMAVGTIAALLRFRRTGTFPGSDTPVEASRGKIIALWVRIVVGMIIAVVGTVTVINTGMF
jgi:hypothetical protein